MYRFNCGQMTAMSSSLATEMPTATGTFHPRIKDTYLPKYVEENLKKFRKVPGGFRVNSYQKSSFSL